MSAVRFQVQAADQALFVVTHMARVVADEPLSVHEQLEFAETIESANSNVALQMAEFRSSWLVWLLHGKLRRECDRPELTPLMELWEMETDPEIAGLLLLEEAAELKEANGLAGTW